MYRILTLLSLTLLASASSGALPIAGALSEPVLQVRQTTPEVPTVAPPGNTNSPRCIDYSNTANYSTIGSNSTYRSAYLQLSPLGSIPVQRMLNAAMKKLPPMTLDAALNTECGNWTTIAFVEGGRNYSGGRTIGGLNGLEKLGNPQAVIRAGPELIAIVGVVLLLFHGVWCFMP